MNFGEKLGEAAYKTAKKMGGYCSTGKCALAVGDALASVLGEDIASKFRGNAYTWLSKVYSDLGQRYWTFLKQSKDTTGLPSGSLIIWNRQKAHPYGHIEVADGRGHLCSDFVRSEKLALYKSNPENVTPHIFVPKDIKLSEFPYKVKVTASALNIRKDCKLTAPIYMTAPKGTVLIVYGVVHTGGTNKIPSRVWGKNELGFFDLQYTERI